ncbi:MAG: DUF1343 domain-containing protein [Verrucomicrobiales bacterium]|jgi:uncharacterized protein YbbC (DUF1343 family)|nr:DUF1343 domain-containing protein [Verrucomicrobiales bacterium]
MNKTLAGLCLCGLLGGWCAGAQARVLVGIDTLRALNFPGLAGKRVGLVTNPAGVDADGVPTWQILRAAKQVRLVALFGPEHGVYGTVKAGAKVADQLDANTGLPVYSLHGVTRKPTPDMLRGIDVLIYDVQDIGARSYTYISTLGLVMQAAAELGIEVYVLDRPDPLGGLRVEGGGVSPDYRSFVGQYDIPYVYGLTPGELALWINDRWLTTPCKLKVFKMNGWTRRMTWRDTGLRWVPTSPNIPTPQAAVGYAATGLLGDIGVTNGANVTAYPFQVIAAENLDAGGMTRRFNAIGLSGVTADPFSFYPAGGKYAGVRYSGIRLDLDPHARANLLAINFRVLDVLRVMTPRKNYFKRASADGVKMFDKINGGPANRTAWLAGRNGDLIARSWRVREASWLAERKPYLLYQ